MPAEDYKPAQKPDQTQNQTQDQSNIEGVTGTPPDSAPGVTNPYQKYDGDASDIGNVSNETDDEDEVGDVDLEDDNEVEDGEGDDAGTGQGSALG